jgi:hypothetical protein
MSPPSTTNPLKRKILYAIKASKRQRSLSSSQSVIDNKARDSSLENFYNPRQSYDSIRKSRLPNGLTDSTLSIKKIRMSSNLCPGCELKMCFRRSHLPHQCRTVEHGQGQEKEQLEDESFSVELNDNHGYSPKFQPANTVDRLSRARPKKLSSTAKFLSN